MFYKCRHVYNLFIYFLYRIEIRVLGKPNVHVYYIFNLMLYTKHLFMTMRKGQNYSFPKQQLFSGHGLGQLLLRYERHEPMKILLEDTNTTCTIVQ